MVSNFKLQLFTQVGWIYLISLVTWNCWSYLLHNFKSNILHEFEKSNKFNSNRKIWKIKKKKKSKKKKQKQKQKQKQNRSGAVCLPERLIVHISTTYTYFNTYLNLTLLQVSKNVRISTTRLLIEIWFKWTIDLYQKNKILKLDICWYVTHSSWSKYQTIWR